MKFSNLYIYHDDDTRLFSEYCTFNQIQHQSVDLWDDGDLSFVISAELIEQNNCCLIIGQRHLLDLSTSKKTYESVVKFCQNNTLFAAKDTGDVFILLENKSFVNSLKTLDSQIPTGSMKFFLDGTAAEDFFLRDLQNIQWVDFPTLERLIFSVPRITGSLVGKTQVTHDFLLTTLLKESRPHRFLLVDELKKYPGLLDRGVCSIQQKENAYDNWLGAKSTEHGWHDHHPSMDLYSKVWLELVPETCHNNFHYITEKTTKTFVTKTPALFVSTCGYLKFLQNLGFKTFGDLIDESYDKEPNLEKRVEKIVATLDHIVRNGAKEFYYSSLHILEHNQKKYFELSGGWTYTTDLFVNSHLNHAVDQ